MKFNTDAWKAEYKATVVAKGAEHCPTICEVGAAATIRYIRKGMVDDIVGQKPEEKWDDNDRMMVEVVRESLTELLKHVQSEECKELCGFGGNASAAAKAAGYKTTAKTLELAD